jgi:DNA-3-methyladenine glycosylase II
MMTFAHSPKGPYDLSNQNSYFGGWLEAGSRPGAIIMAFPIEGWQGSAAVVIWQEEGGSIRGEVHGQERLAPVAWQQALAALSLDWDGSGWAEAGSRDPILGRLQVSYKLLRPVLFHSPYEAAAAFVIGHRISIRQGRAIRQAMALEHGDHLEAGNIVVHAFPRPQVLRAITSIKGVSPAKISRLHGIAEAAMEGWLDRAALRAMAEPDALEKLRSLEGIGGFFSQGILYRGAGLADAVTDDQVTRQAFQKAFSLAKLPDHRTVLGLAEPWKPFRMWATVLLHVSYRREESGAPRSLRHRARKA